MYLQRVPAYSAPFLPHVRQPTYTVIYTDASTHMQAFNPLQGAGFHRVVVRLPALIEGLCPPESDALGVSPVLCHVTCVLNRRSQPHETCHEYKGSLAKYLCESGELEKCGTSRSGSLVSCARIVKCCIVTAHCTPHVVETEESARCDPRQVWPHEP
jgi:hypothetical protein